MEDLRTVLREHLDVTDSATRKLIISLDEATTKQQSQVIISLTSRLYDKIQDKVDKVDFSYVSASRGDITKIPHYDELCDCLDIIHRLVVEYRQDTAPVDTVTTAIDNLKVRTGMFKKAFAINAPLPTLTYNSIALGIVQSTSLLIATSVEYIKDPNADTFKMALDTVAYNKTRDNLMFNNLKTFNESCRTREFDKAMNVIMERTIAKEAFEFNADGSSVEVPNQDIAPVAPQDGPKDLVDDLEAPVKTDITVVAVKPVDTVNGEPVHGNDKPFLTDEEIKNDEVKVINDDKPLQEKTNAFAFIGSALNYVKDKVWLGILNTFIPMVRNFVYQFEFQRQKAADYYQMQADLLQMNAMDLQYNNGLSDAEKKTIYNKQMQQVNKFRQHANNLAIDMKTSEVNGSKQSASEARSFKASELDDYMNDNDDIYSNSSLF